MDVVSELQRLHFVSKTSRGHLTTRWEIRSAALTRLLFWDFFRGSAQPAVTAGITVTPTSPARSTQKTSAVSSVTVATSYRGCI